MGDAAVDKREGGAVGEAHRIPLPADAQAAGRGETQQRTLQIHLRGNTGQARDQGLTHGPGGGTEPHRDDPGDVPGRGEQHRHIAVQRPGGGDEPVIGRVRAVQLRDVRHPGPRGLPGPFSTSDDGDLPPRQIHRSLIPAVHPDLVAAELHPRHLAELPPPRLIDTRLDQRTVGNDIGQGGGSGKIHGHHLNRRVELRGLCEQ
ncbi:hypothetical protein QP028_02720 [Corynebacterium suedekumii]|nr:hypothetical protein QP028_02720 [Corynebacterium suedekumii]